MTYSSACEGRSRGCGSYGLPHRVRHRPPDDRPPPGPWLGRSERLDGPQRDALQPGPAMLRWMLRPAHRHLSAGHHPGGMRRPAVVLLSLRRSDGVLPHCWWGPVRLQQRLLPVQQRQLLRSQLRNGATGVLLRRHGVPGRRGVLLKLRRRDGVRRRDARSHARADLRRHELAETRTPPSQSR
jgi:hypothetical protein